MPLTYRGVRYQANTPSLETSEAEIVGKYRGADLSFQRAKEICVPQSALKLRYRGVEHPSFRF